jgi:hypothetical protein
MVRGWGEGCGKATPFICWLWSACARAFISLVTVALLAAHLWWHRTWARVRPHPDTGAGGAVTTPVNLSGAPVAGDHEPGVTTAGGGDVPTAGAAHVPRPSSGPGFSTMPNLGSGGNDSSGGSVGASQAGEQVGVEAGGGDGAQAGMWVQVRGRLMVRGQ